MYQQVIREGELGPSARRGLMNLIPKKNKDTRYIKNLRPLTLLNIDYKILAAACASRIKKVLPHIIGEQQCGFMEGRDIQDVIRTTMDVLTHVNNKHNEKICIVTIDFIKCFDMISHKGLFGALEYFNFGEKFINYIKIFFKNFIVCTQNAGYTSQFFKKTRGINQGCPISPFLFLCASEILTHLLKGDKRVKGIKLGQIEHIISQFADDSTLFLTYSTECFTAAIEKLDVLRQNLGLEISYEKTTVYRVGSLKNTDAKIYTHKQLQWSDGDIDLLGVRISNTGIQSNTGINEIIDKMTNIANNWYYRTLTLFGKVLVINTLLASMFVYTMCALPVISHSQFKRIEKIITNFLWNNGTHKIPLQVLYLPKNRGGMGLANLLFRHYAVHLKSIIKLSESVYMQSYVYDWLIPALRHAVWDININRHDLGRVIKVDSHWKNVALLWSDLHYHTPHTCESMLEQIIWCNSHIKISGKVIMPQTHLMGKGLYKLRSIIDEEGRLMTREQMQSEFDTNINWLWYLQLKAAIPVHWLNTIQQSRQEIDNTEVESIDLDNTSDTQQLEYCKLLDKKNPCRFFYRSFINQSKLSTYERYGRKWMELLKVEITESEYYQCFNNIYRTTNVTYLRNFQYRLLLNKIYANDILYKWGTVKSNRCNFCLKEVQTVIHMLCECNVIKPLWAKIFDILQHEISMQDIILGNPSSSKKIVNFVILVAKKYIFNCKCQDTMPTVKGLVAYLKYWENIERFNAYKTNTSTTHYEKWNGINDILAEKVRP